MATIEQITPDFINGIVSSRDDDAGPQVIDVAALQVGSGQMGRCYQLQLSYDSDAPGLPTRMIAKLPSTDAGSREFATALRAYAREVEFYRLVAPQLSVRTPRCYAASVNADGSDFHLLLEDLSPATECGQIEGCDAAQAEVVLREAAALHAGSWRNPRMLALEFLRTGLAVWQQIGAAVQPTSVAFLQRYGERLEPAAVDIAEHLGDGAASGWIQSLEEPRCLWHSDLRLDNVLFDGSAGKVPVALVDWQSVTMAPGPIDVSYFVGSGMSIEARRTSEGDLLRAYHDALLDGGVVDYPWEQCLREYRSNAVAGFLVAMFASVSVEQTERGDAMFTVLANRHAEHMVDHESLKLIGNPSLRR